ncbi:hypothetical protein DSECCO2_307440 [anaerobic digester metagenome]|jgi:hypothetical protein
MTIFTCVCTNPHTYAKNQFAYSSFITNLIDYMMYEKNVVNCFFKEKFYSFSLFINVPFL